MGYIEFLYFLVASVILISKVECSEISLTFKLGSITGISETVEFNGEMKNVTRFLGIPYAKPPTGDKRFERPEPYGNYSLPYNATYFRPHCMQSETVNPSIKYFGMSEDCLHLNIFIPGNALSSETKKKYTVMIFIHGGAFIYSGAEAFSGDQLSAFHDVVVVTLNYRLNTFGFLSNGAASSGNMGLWDQKLAIKWVHDNIADFAGDPEKVTLFGNSAGAASVLYQTLNPSNRGLYQRIITQSGNVLAQWAQQYNPREMFEEFVSEVNCNMKQYDDILKCLQSKPAEELITTRFAPVVDGDFVTEDPSVTFSKLDADNSLSLLTEVDFLSGVQSKEGAETVDRLSDSFKAFGVDIANGVPRNIFENQFLSSILPQMYGAVVPRALVQSVIQQYIDWSRPEDTKMIRDKMVDFWSDVAFFVPAINTIRKHKVLGKPSKTSYFYVFDHKPPFDSTPLWLKGAKHAMELPYVFGMPDSLKIAAGLPPNFPLPIPVSDLTLSSNIMKLWTNFAKTGNPNSPLPIDAGIPQWPQYDISSQSYLEFSSNMTSDSIKNHFAASKVEFWTNLVPLLEKCETCVDKNCTENQQTSLALSISENISLKFIFLLFVQVMLTQIGFFM